VRESGICADAEAYDFLFLAAGDFLVLELDRAVRNPGPAADQVEHGGLAGAVRPDDDRAVALVDVEVERVDALNPSKETLTFSSASRKSVLLAMIACSNVIPRAPDWARAGPRSPASQPRNKLIGYETCETAREREHDGNEQPPMANSHNSGKRLENRSCPS
jgi:hypothetical protein